MCMCMCTQRKDAFHSVFQQIHKIEFYSIKKTISNSNNNNNEMTSKTPSTSVTTPTPLHQSNCDPFASSDDDSFSDWNH